MKYSLPEECGISSAAIEKFMRLLEDRRVYMHDIIIAKGDNIIFEKYWAPFHENFLHRQYSVSKSFISIAIGFALQEGLIDLDDPIGKYFPDEAKTAPNKLLPKQTIRQMLTMSTTVEERNWLAAAPPDRVKFYFENPNTDRRPSGTVFNYDSTGSFVLGAMIERLTGMSIADYLRERLFRKIGVSEEVRCLKCTGGHSWADSAFLTTARDLLLITRFVLNGGKWNGEQILNEEYLKTATSKLVHNDVSGSACAEGFGYGYLIWRTFDDSWFFNGLGGQFAVAVPHKDLILITNGDNQGPAKSLKLNTVIEGFFNLIVRGEQNLEDAKAAQASLAKYTENLKLLAAEGDPCSDFAEKINGKRFNLEENRMGIKYMKLSLTGGVGTLEYENATGKKSFAFGLCKNVFGTFPEGYNTDEVGTVVVPDRHYKYGASAAWVEERKLFIHVQVIDTYFGKLNITLGWQDENTLGVYMTKASPHFFENYQGYAEGYAE